MVVGRTTLVKGVPYLLNAFTNVVKKYPDCRLVIIGSVYDPASILKLSKRIVAKISYTGLVGKDELTQWYKIAEIGLIHSLSEQCSYSGIEMMMHGLPVVASDGFGVRCMFKDGVNARIAIIGNRKKMRGYETNLTNAILELLISDEQCKQLSKNARKVYDTYHTSEKMHEKYTKLLEALN